jgi:hypothetical protein
VIEAGVVVGLMVAWAVRKARRVGQRLDATSDAALDAGVDRLDALVRSKLAGHPALRDLDEEAAAAPVDPPSTTGIEVSGAAPEGGVSELTREQLELSLRAALAKDEDFAAELAEAVAAVQGAEPAGGAPGGTSMTARASGRGRVYQAGRDQHINER